jgi:hypothetical protein
LNAIDILTNWILIAGANGMVQRQKDFWLLRDCLEKVWSETFMENHRPEVIKILDGLDDSKEQVFYVKQAFLDLGIYKPSYQKELF